MNKFKSFCKRASLAVGAVLTAGVAHATTNPLVTEAQTAITSAAADAKTVGGYVIAAVLGLIVVGVIIGIGRKVRA